jgi:uncharacterized protein (DUF736 family)
VSDKEYDNTNRGALFRNHRKEQPNHPDHQGSLNVGGVDYWISAWVKESKKDGKKFFSLSVKPKEVNAPPREPESKPAPAADFDDDIPF